MTLTRVQIPVHTDRWMMGDRYGTLLRVTKDRRSGVEIAHVKLDKSGKVMKFIYSDCEDVQ